MGKPLDAKIELLSTSPLCQHLPREHIVALGRLSELVTVPEGTVIRSADRTDPWSYHVLTGTVLVSTEDTLESYSRGSWILGEPFGQPVTATAATEVTFLAFGLRELHSARALLAQRR